MTLRKPRDMRGRDDRHLTGCAGWNAKNGNGMNQNSDLPAHVVEDQSAVFAFLADPATHGLENEIKRIDTHGAVVFLASEDVYKLKRAVKFPFMDYSTLALRKTACEREIAVNKEAAPDIYLGIVAITRDGDALTLGGDGEPIEWAVHMRRFDETKTLDLIAEKQGLPQELLKSLVKEILAAHQRAPRRDTGPAIASLASYLEQNSEAYAENPELYPQDRAAALTEASKMALTALTPLLQARGEAGFVRRCHGDLHLRNIVLIADKPTIFDAVEFDEAIATGDVLYDLGFLLMDLWERGLHREANIVMNRYLWGSDASEIDGLAALPLFLSIRATIRSKVIAAALPHLDGEEKAAKAAEARRYFAAAEAFLQPVRPRLVAIGGLSGSGKTTLAARIAPQFGRAPGAVHLRSDIERKRLAGVGETESLPDSAYASDFTARVFDTLWHKAERALKAGASVIVDAVHATPEERRQVEIVARENGADFVGLWLEAPIETLIDRVRHRSNDASDATAEIVRRQTGYKIGEIAWPRLTVTGSVDDSLAQALKTLGFSADQ